MSFKEFVLNEAPKHAWGILLVQRDSLKQLLARLFEEKKHLEILEVGCFKGMLVGWLEENFPKSQFSWNYYGVDIVEPQDRRRDYTHYVMNAESLEFEAERFDLVIMIEVLEHIVDYVRALREVYRVLKRDGYLFIQSVICTDKTALSDPTHFHVLHPTTLIRLLKWLGFKVERIDGGGNFAIWCRK